MNQETMQQTNLAPKTKWLMSALFILPLVLMAGKLAAFPTSAAFSHLFSIPTLPKHFHRHVEYIFFVPLSALVVAFFRLTLGIRVLGLFRPILIAIAFQTMGIPVGLAFLIAVLGAVALLRPMLRDAPYYARVPVILSLVATLLLIPVIAATWWHAQWLNHLAYFPIIALGLSCESFATVLDKKGIREAIWRTLMTVAVAIIVAGVAKIPGAMQTFFRFPELLLVQAGLILFISEYLNFEWFHGKNPLRHRVRPLASSGWAGAAPPEKAASSLISPTSI
jgi:7 transmembrane helices usually fused to an inactive transglutaminase